MSERSLERNSLIYYLRVTDESSGKRLGYLADISTAGLMVMAHEKVGEGAKYNLRVELPRAIPGEHAGRSIRLKAVAKWAEKDNHSSFYRTGFELTDTSSQAVDSIRRLIRDYLYQEPPEGELDLPGE